MIQLRPYQEQLVSATREAYTKHRRVIMQLPTGGGKSACFGFIVKSALAKGNRVLIATNRSEILTQNRGMLSSIGIMAERIVSKTKEPPASNVAVGMLQTINRRLNKSEWQEYIASINMLVIDECHTQDANKLLDAISDKTFVLGVSATPSRSGNQRQLGMDYECIVKGSSCKDLVEQGFLVKCNHYGLSAPKLDYVKYDRAKGDYNQAQMARIFENRTKYAGAVRNWTKLTPNTPTIAFCASAKAAIDLCKEFSSHGVSSKYLLSGSFEEDDEFSGDRDEVLTDFAMGRFDVLCSVGILTAGVDIPAIRTCILNFATTSVSKYLQAIGRCSRPYAGKDVFSVLDLGGNWERHGLFDDEREWSLWHKTSEGGGVAPTKLCPVMHGGCDRLIPTVSKKCPFCGYIFPTEKEIYEIELDEIIEKNPGTLESWIAQKKKEGRKNLWILYSICARNKSNQKKAFCDAIDILNKQHGCSYTRKYWHQFNKQILNKKL